jgi:hypothetical protein
VVDGAEGPGSLNELNELVVASLQPLQTVEASKSGAEGEGRAGRVKVEDGGSRGGDVHRHNTSRHRGEARHGFEKELEIPVVGFPLTALRQTLAGQQQEGIHVASQVRQ